MLSLTAAKILKEIATFGGNIRKIVSLVRRAIDFVQDLSKLIPALLQAAAALAAVMKATNAVLKLSARGRQRRCRQLRQRDRGRGLVSNATPRSRRWPSSAPRSRSPTARR